MNTRAKKWIPKQIQQQATTTHQTKTEPVKQFMFNDAAEEFVPLDRQKEAQEVQTTNDEAERSPSISKEEVSKDAPFKAAKKKRTNVQNKEEEKTTEKTPKEASAPQTATKQEEQDDDMLDEETMDFIKELHNLARKGMRTMRNCPPEKKNVGSFYRWRSGRKYTLNLWIQRNFKLEHNICRKTWTLYDSMIRAKKPHAQLGKQRFRKTIGL